jgi:TPR repeat protein
MCLHFQNALKLRKLERYDEAGEELKLTNDPEGRVHLGYAYLYGGFGIAQDEKKGVEILENSDHSWANVLLKIYNPDIYALDSNENDAFTMCVYHYFYSPNVEITLENMISALDEGNPFIISLMIRAIHQKLHKFTDKLEKYIKAGDAHTQFMVGFYEKSEYWLRKAVAQKLQFAYHHLAVCLKNNPTHVLEATRLFILAKKSTEDFLWV